MEALSGCGCVVLENVAASSAFSSLLKRHRDALLSTALPAHVWQTERKWLYFLEHGHLPADTEGPEAELGQLSRVDVLTLIVVIDDYEQAHPRAASAIRPTLMRLAST
jgi:hypothetical protein